MMSDAPSEKTKKKPSKQTKRERKTTTPEGPAPPIPAQMEPPHVEVTSALQALINELPDFEEADNVQLTVVNEGDAASTVAEPPSSPPAPSTPLSCPIHNVPLTYAVSQRGWEYVTCDETDCPMWCATTDAPALTHEFHLQACDDVKTGPFECHCGEPYKMSICKSEKNLGRLFLACKQDDRCNFFRWADTPKKQKKCPRTFSQRKPYTQQHQRYSPYQSKPNQQDLTAALHRFLTAARR